MAEWAVILVPMLPPQECSPNWRGHWRSRHAAARAWRECAYLSALAGDAGADFDGLVVMDIAVQWGGRRKAMDSDNLVAACKPARDGVADALFGGDDSRIQVGTVTQRRGEGVTVLTLREGL